MEAINRLGWYQTMYPDPVLQEKARQRMAAMRVGDDLVYERWVITRADGGQRTLGISTSVLAAPDGETYVLGLMQDVSVEEEYRKQLEGRAASLEGLLSVCSSCKRIRSDEDQWQPLEEYLSDNTEARLTHGFCPECVRILYPHFKRGRA